jgi:hypothetical protein
MQLEQATINKYTSNLKPDDITAITQGDDFKNISTMFNQFSSREVTYVSIRYILCKHINEIRGFSNEEKSPLAILEEESIEFIINIDSELCEFNKKICEIIDSSKDEASLFKTLLMLTVLNKKAETMY